MADEPYLRFRQQVEQVISSARLTEADRDRVRRAVEDRRREGIPLSLLRSKRRAAKVATYLCSVLAYADVETPDRAGDLERAIFDCLAAQAVSRRRVITRRTVAVVAVAVALLFAAAGAVPEMLGDWPYNAFGKSSRAKHAHHQSPPVKSGLAAFEGA